MNKVVDTILGILALIVGGIAFLPALAAGLVMFAFFGAILVAFVIGFASLFS